MSRKRSTPLNLSIEVFDGIDIDQINIPISPNNHKFSISLNPNSITVGRRNTQGEGVVYSIPRSTNPHNFLNDTKSTKIENVKQFTHYGTSCSDEELIYLLT
jgi:archaellin